MRVVSESESESEKCKVKVVEVYFEAKKNVKDEDEAPAPAPALGNSNSNNIPKGYLAVLVGVGEEQRRFVIPVIYVNHPLFMKLLKEAEEEYGFDHKGPIIIPCGVDHFLTVQCMIHQEKPFFHHLHLPLWCFRA